jgi:glycosyltransferase involved in cell wall biosynthesis
MRYAVDAHAIGRHLTGNEVYIRSLLRAFTALDRDSQFLAYVCEEEAEAWLPRRVRVHRVARNPWVRLGWDLARRVREDCPDLLHVQYTAPLGMKVPLVVTVHDVSFLEHPEYFTRTRRMQLRQTVARTVRQAARVLTVSEFSRGQILKAYDLSPEIVTVVPNAASEEFRVTGRERAQSAAAQTTGSESPFVLSVGDLQPRKNQIGLIEAFARMVMENPHLDHNLVLTGQDTWFTPKVREAARASGIASRIIFTGFVTDSALLHLYNACDCFVFPSFYEGFGLPIVEAMACGRAVACSDTSAMPEVADGAAVLFDPHSVGSMQRAMADLLLEPELRHRKERLGIQRAGLFNWNRSALATLEVYREVTRAKRTPAEAGHRTVVAGKGK